MAVLQDLRALLDRESAGPIIKVNGVSTSAGVWYDMFLMKDTACMIMIHKPWVYSRID
jgi:hypothetical protein